MCEHVSTTLCYHRVRRNNGSQSQQISRRRLKYRPDVLLQVSRYIGSFETVRHRRDLSRYSRRILNKLGVEIQFETPAPDPPEPAFSAGDLSKSKWQIKNSHGIQEVTIKRGHEKEQVARLRY